MLRSFCCGLLLVFAIGFLTSSEAVAGLTYTEEWGWRSDKEPVFGSAEEQFEFAWGLQKQKMFKEAARAYDSILRYFDTDLAGMAAYRSAVCLIESGRYYRAYTRLEFAMKNFRGKILLSNSLEKRKKELALQKSKKASREELFDLTERIGMLERLVKEQPNDEKTEDMVRLIVDKEYKIAQAFLNGAKREFLYVPLLNGYKEAQEIFEKARSYDRFGKYGDDCLLGAGQALVKQKKFDEAVKYFDRLLREYPDTPLQSLAYFEMGESYYMKNHYAHYDFKTLERAKESYQKYLQLTENKGIRAAEAQTRLNAILNNIAEWQYRFIDYYERNSHYKAAVATCKKVMKEYKDTEWGRNASARLAELEAKAAKDRDYKRRQSRTEKEARRELAREAKRREKFRENERKRVVFFQAEQARRLRKYIKNQQKAIEKKKKFEEEAAEDRAYEKPEKGSEETAVPRPEATKPVVSPRAVESVKAVKATKAAKAAEKIDPQKKINGVLAVSELIDLLRDADPDIRKQASAELARITGKDFGQDYNKWYAWWNRR